MNSVVNTQDPSGLIKVAYLPREKETGLNDVKDERPSETIYSQGMEKKRYKNVKHVHILRAKRVERAESFLPPFLPLNARCTNKSKLSKAPREAAVAQSFLHAYSEILVS